MATSSTICLHIIGISVDCSGSKKNIEFAEVQLRKIKTPIERDPGAAETFHRKFDTPLKLSRKDTFSLRLLHNTEFEKGEVEIKFDTKEIVHACGANQEHEYRKSHDGIAIVVIVENLGLHYTTDDIFKYCPRFRILIVGKTGVGKTSLINHAFGVQDALASNNTPGEADIEEEFISLQNDRLVLHNNRGFEPGDENNVKIVQEFIQRRRDKLALKDKLHAVWLCFEIPRAGGRLLETGTKEFLKLKHDGELGNVPVIVVLTKYDMLLGRVERMLSESSLERLTDNDIEKYIKEKADAELLETCTKPLERFAGSTIPWAVVSKKEEHKDMVSRLVQITEECVRQHVATEASVMADVAQRVDPMLNINTSIEVGRRKYWKALASTTAFKGQTVQACLEVLHTDIVRVWNFQDTHRYLESDEFKKLVVNLVDRLDSESIANPNSNTSPRTVGHSIPVPIIAPATWFRDVYQLPRVVLRHFIAYIVDLTMVLQTLYLLSSNEDVTRRMIKLAVAVHSASSTIAEVHDRIKMYDGHLPVLDSRLDEETLAMIEALMNEFSIKVHGIPELRELIADISSQQDEQW